MRAHRQSSSSSSFSSRVDRTVSSAEEIVHLQVLSDYVWVWLLGPLGI